MRRLLIVVALGGVIAAAWLAGLGNIVRLANAELLRRALLESGPVAPLLYVGLYIIGGLALIPGFVLTLLGGLIFGPWQGLAYASIGSTLAACTGFLIARYAARGFIETWVARRPALHRLDSAVTRHGFRIVILTRLVPMVPFGVLNYAFGVTGVAFPTYAFLSWACMLPSTAALTFTAGTLATAARTSPRTLAWLAVGGVVIVLLSLVPRLLVRRSAALRELWSSDD